MSVQVVVAVLNIFVSGSGTAYGEHFAKYGERRGVDPLLVAAVAYHESLLRPSKVSRTNDYGLMQLHVGDNTHARYVGREKLLFEPGRNIRLGVRMLAWWKAHHQRRCGSEHHWLLHYNQGSRVAKRGWRSRYADRVLKIYHKLLKIKSRVLRNRDVTS